MFPTESEPLDDGAWREKQKFPDGEMRVCVGQCHGHNVTMLLYEEVDEKLKRESLLRDRGRRRRQNEHRDRLNSLPVLRAGTN
jgi:hypothetical protein